MPTRRFLTVLCTAAVAALAGPTIAGAAQRQAAGPVVSMDWSSFTIQTSSRGMGVLNAMTAAANRITASDYAYVYGGGHARAGTASIGIKGPGYNGTRAGFDCSGSVAAVLAGAGVWPAGTGVPADNGIISELLSEHLIARGIGTGAQEVTLWDKPGVHIFMNIDGRFFGTSDGGAGNPGQKHGGAGWLSDGAPDTLGGSFHPYHLLPAVLRGRTTYGPMLTLTAAPGSTVLDGLSIGDRVRVAYSENSRGVFIAKTIAYLGTTAVTGTLADVADDGSSLQVTVGTRTLTLSTGANGSLLAGAQIGDRVRVTYTGSAGTLTAHTLTVLAAPTILQATGIIQTLAADGSGLVLLTTDDRTLALTTADNAGLVAGLVPGDTITISYAKNPDGTLVLQQAQNVLGAGQPGPVQGAAGTGRAVGPIAWIDWRHSTITVQIDNGRNETFSVAANPGMIDGFATGDIVQVTYTQNADGSLTATAVAAD
jgi:hypothetical protein